MWWPGYAPAATTALGWGSVLQPAPACVPVSQGPAQRNWLWLPWFYLFGLNLNLYVMLQSCFHTWLDCKLERECAFLTTAKYDWRWEYHTSCNLLLNGYDACGWLRTWADGQIRQMHRSYAGRLFPASSPLQLGLKDTCSKCLRGGLSVHHLSEHCSAENPAACLGRVARVESLGMTMTLKRVSAGLGSFSTGSVSSSSSRTAARGLLEKWGGCRNDRPFQYAGWSPLWSLRHICTCLLGNVEWVQSKNWGTRKCKWPAG